MRCGTSTRDELVVEAAGLDGGNGALLALERERVLTLARDVPALGHVLGGLAHRIGVVAAREFGVREAPAKGRIGHLARAAVVAGFRLELDVRGAGHRFDATADEHVAVPDRDRVRRRVDRLEPGTTQPIDGQATDLDREIGQQERHPRHVSVVLAGLVRTAEDHVFDEGRVEPGAIHHGTQHGGGEIVRPDTRQGAAVAADRGPDRLDDPGFADGSLCVSGHGGDGSAPEIGGGGGRWGVPRRRGVPQRRGRAAPAATRVFIRGRPLVMSRELFPAVLRGGHRGRQRLESAPSPADRARFRAQER